VPEYGHHLRAHAAPGSAKFCSATPSQMFGSLHKLRELLRLCERHAE
jgi:hypothetical protein